MRSTFLAASALIVLTGTTSLAQTTRAELSEKNSWMTYRLTHPLHEIEATSKEVQYRVEIDPSTRELRSVAADVEVTTFDSGNSNRDSHAMEVIDAIDFPEASFVSSSVAAVGDSLRISGKLTFHGVTQDIIMMARPRWSADSLEVTGAFELSLTAFRIERPALLMIPVEDALRFTFAAAFILH